MVPFKPRKQPHNQGVHLSNSSDSRGLAFEPCTSRACTLAKQEGREEQKKKKLNLSFFLFLFKLSRSRLTVSPHPSRAPTLRHLSLYRGNHESPCADFLYSDLTCTGALVYPVQERVEYSVLEGYYSTLYTVSSTAYIFD